MTPGIHLMHKPVGPTSFSLVQACIKSTAALQTHAKPKICHGGTLDPFAHGLLLMLSGSATRLFEYLHTIPKTYHATVQWGTETDNGDPHGQPVSTGDPSTLSPQQLDDALATFIGWHDQIPPATSNKRVDGERAYLKAHRGETVIMPPVRVYLHEARWLSHDLPRQSQLEMTVRGGYYVRALARDLGRLVSCGAHLAALHRTAIGPWIDPRPDQTVELHGHELLPWAKSRILSDQDVGDLRQGQTIALTGIVPAEWTPPDGFPDPDAPIRGFHLGKLVALLRPIEGRLGAISALRGGL